MHFFRTTKVNKQNERFNGLSQSSLNYLSLHQPVYLRVRLSLISKLSLDRGPILKLVDQGGKN